MSQSVLVADEQSLVSTAEKISAGTLYDVSVKPRASLLGTRADGATKVGSKVAKVSYRVIKRGSDILFGFIGCLFVFPIAVFVKLAYVVTGDFDPIFFVQKRIGKDGREFNFFKFRTMVKNADEVLEEIIKEEPYKTEWKKYKKLRKDPRISKVGHLLRRTSLDEFPQFFNVLKGDMSLIGNRPYMPREKDDISERAYAALITTKPGITGYWQVSGRSNVKFDDRVELEEFYSKNASLGFDTEILFKTFRAVLSREGAD